MKLLEKYRELCGNVRVAKKNLDAAQAKVTTTYNVSDWKNFGRIESCINCYEGMVMPWFARHTFENIKFEKCCDEYDAKRLCQCGNCKYAEQNRDAVAARLSYDDAVRARRAYFRNLLPWGNKQRGK